MVEALIGRRDGYDDLYSVERMAELSGGAVADPYPRWRELLARGPVHRGTLAECTGLPPGQGVPYAPRYSYYSIFSFAAVSDVFTRRDDFCSEVYVEMGTVHEFGDTILNMDGVRHRRMRDLLQPQFQPVVATGWWRETIIEPLVTQLIARFEDEDGVDLSTEYFSYLPLHTMTTGFGMPFADGLAFREQMLRSVHAEDAATRDAARDEAGAILGRVIRERRGAPRDDLISRLAHATIEEEDGASRRLTEEEIASYCRLVMHAGGETTWRQLGNIMYALLTHPEQLAQVIADRSLLPNAILESTRWMPDALFPRKVARDTMLHGTELPAGAHLHLCLGSANRDPARWDEPDRFDIHRPVQRSVAFAAGAHSCLGQHVARQEIASALNALFDRFPNIRWDPAKPPARITGSIAQRGPNALHVLLH